MENKKLVVIDGNSFIFRAFYATAFTNNLMKTKDGIATNALFGYINFIEAIIRKSNPDYLFIALDKGSNTFRKKLYSDYKAHRDAAPSDLVSQFSLVREYMDKRNIVWMESDDFEADDIVGSICEKFHNEIQIEVYTGDRDYLQLVKDNVKVSIIKKGGLSESILYDNNSVIEEYGVDPKTFIDLKAICGDKSDNIPGVAGIGEKTALKYLLKYDNLINLYENIESEKPTKTRDKFIIDKENALLSYELAKIKLDIDLGLSLDSLILNEEYTSEFKSFLENYELKSMIKRFFSEKKIESKSYEVVFDNKLSKADKIFFVTTFEESYHFNDILYVIYEIDNKIYITDTFDKHFLETIIDEKTIVFDSKKINSLLSKYGIQYVSFENDVMLKSYVVNSETSSNQAFKYNQDFNLSIAEDKIWKKTFKSNNTDEINEFISGQAVELIKFLDLASKYYDNSIKINKFDKLSKLEVELSKVLFEMEKKGIQFNDKVNDNLLEKISTELDKLEKEIIGLAGCEFNINSPKQLGEVLFVKLGITYPKKSFKTFSTSVDILEKLSSKNLIVALILEYRKLNKLSSTYLKAFSKFIINGRIHTIYNQVGTATGRLSSNYPNLQNIPVRSELGRQVREAFEATEGSVLLSIDYSQIELRVIAALAKEMHMLNAFEVGYDIHKDTAAKILHVDYDDVTSEQRKVAKAINFGIIYGMGPKKLSQDLNISIVQAKEFIEKYLDTYSNISSYMSEVITIAKENEFVKTYFDRIRYLPNINERNKMVSSLNERIAVNSPIQGTAADIIKFAMVKIYNDILENSSDISLLLQIHDELIFEVKEEKVEEYRSKLIEVMENVVDLGVKLECNYKVGKNWFDMKGI